jgi:hypothetical protein
MVLAAIAQGLSPQISNTVLTRRLHDTPAREEYEYLSVQRFWNPAPAVWKEYAVGVQHGRPKKCGHTLISSARWVPPFDGRVRSRPLHFPLPLGLSALGAAFVKRPSSSRFTGMPMSTSCHVLWSR